MSALIKTSFSLAFGSVSMADPFTLSLIAFCRV